MINFEIIYFVCFPYYKILINEINIYIQIDIFKLSLYFFWINYLSNMVIWMTSILQKISKNLIISPLILAPTLWHQKCGEFFLKISKIIQTYDKKKRFFQKFPMLH